MLVSLSFTPTYTYAFTDLSSRSFNATVVMRIPYQDIKYIPSVSEVLKLAWIQYISFFIVVAFVLFRMNSFIFRHQVLLWVPYEICDSSVVVIIFSLCSWYSGEEEWLEVSLHKSMKRMISFASYRSYMNDISQLNIYKSIIYRLRSPTIVSGCWPARHKLS